jgi:hypothetical protein
MSEPNHPVEHGDEGAPDEGTELQFDEAEPTSPTSTAATCAGCKRPITDAYYEINGKVVCASCRDQIEASFRGGSRVARVLKATTLGIVAAAAGAVVYYAILKATDYHIGLVAVVVGYMVGSAVKKGSGGRGGLFYQLLALFLTYSSIVGFHVPYLFQLPAEPAGGQEQPAAIKPAAPKGNPAKDKAKAEPPALAKDEKKQKPAEKAKAANPAGAAAPKDAAVDHENPVPAENVPEEPVSLQRFALLLMLLLITVIGSLYSLPVQIAMQDPLLGVIFSFALWEAWKITRGAKLAFNGPFRVNPDIPKAADPEVIGDAE